MDSYVWPVATFVVLTWLLSLIPYGWVLAAVAFLWWLAGRIIKSMHREVRR